VPKLEQIPHYAGFDPVLPSQLHFELDSVNPVRRGSEVVVLNARLPLLFSELWPVAGLAIIRR